jgi:hypothetical protein
MTPAATNARTLVWPALRYKDAPAAIRFLVDGLGFEEVAVYPGEAEGTIAHAALAWRWWCDAWQRPAGQRDR